MQPSTIQYVISGAVVLLVLAFRMRGMSKARRLRLEQLWIVPAIYIVVAAAALWFAPPQLADWPWLIGAALIGGAFGWYRGKMMRITVDPETHAMNQQASPLFMILLLAIIGLRQLVRVTMQEESTAWGISLAVLTDAPLLLIVAMLSIARVEMFIRGTRLLNEARAAKADRSTA